MTTSVTTSMTTSGGVPCDLTHNALDVTSLLSRDQMMGLAWYTCLYSVAPKHYGKVTWDPPQRVGQSDRQTLVKHYLPTLHVQVVKTFCSTHLHSCLLELEFHWSPTCSSATVCCVVFSFMSCLKNIMHNVCTLKNQRIKNKWELYY